MHDLDRAMFETGEVGYQPEHTEHEEFLEILGEQLEGEAGQGESSPAAGAVDRTTYETELAAELLDVQTEAELDRFLGKVLGRAAGLARNFARSDTGRALGGILAKAAKDTLPLIGRKVGSFIDSGYGDVGERLGKAAGVAFGLELEGLSQEDSEFEVARAFVRFANAAGRHAAQAPRGTPPHAAAMAATTAAARRYAPGLLGRLVPGGTAQPRRHSGRWERQEDKIILFGV